MRGGLLRSRTGAVGSARSTSDSPTNRSRSTTRSSGSASTTSAPSRTTSSRAESPIRRFYEWSEFTRFIAAILGIDEIFPFADPLGALNLAVMTDGDQLQWHFDGTDFVVSLAIQSADVGGDFEVAPQIRAAGDEHYDDVARVLGGERERVMTQPMKPGTLLVFAGRYSLHRVSPIEGSTPRLVALLGYDTKPGTMSSDLLKEVRYGRIS